MRLQTRSLLFLSFTAVLISVPIFLVTQIDAQPWLENSGPQETQSPSEQTRERKKTILPPYGFSEITPPGKWSAVAEFDVSQTNDHDIPVVIVGLGSYAGKGAWAKQLMVDNVTLRNRTEKEIQSIKLGWIIITAEDRKAGKNRHAALRDGFTNVLPVRIPPDRMAKLEDLQIDFVKEAKDLITSGKLNGMVFIRLRVVEVEFADGLSWREGAAVAKRNHAARPLAQSGCEDRACLFQDTGQGFCDLFLQEPTVVARTVVPTTRMHASAIFTRAQIVSTWTPTDGPTVKVIATTLL